MRIGLFGGSFDPVHHAHIKIAESAARQHALDKVIFIPAKNPPHRFRKNLADARSRIDMLKLALAGKRNFEISDFELRRKRTTYTYETINHFKKKFPSSDIFFIIGSDSLKEMRNWKKGAELLGLCKFIVAPRPGFNPAPFVKVMGQTRTNSRFTSHQPSERCGATNEILYIKNVSYQISSSAIRKNICNDKILSQLLPMEVFRYIKKKFLYIDEPIREYLKKHLDSAKYIHIIGASKTAQLLALKFRADERKTLISSLLHDLGRTVGLKNYVSYVKKNKLKIPMRNEIEKRNPFLLHSYISADLAQKIFNMTDGEILKAVANHTFGAPEQKASIYDKIIYISDTIAPDRRFVGISDIRKIAFRDLDKAVLMCAASKLFYIIKKKKWLAPTGVEVYNSYLKKTKDKFTTKARKNF